MDINNSQPVKERDRTLGNGLAAAKDIAPGDVIVRINDTFLIVVEKAALEQVCSYCLAEAEASTLKRCVGCQKVRYCNATCQQADWKLIHKSECSLFRRLPDVPPTPVRALYQALRRNLPIEQDSSSISPQEHHFEELKNEKKTRDEILLQARAAVEFSKSPISKMDDVAKFMCLLTTNAFRATLPDDTPIGLCYEPKLALANHSCIPNSFIMFDGRCILLMALNPIKAGESLFISYVDFTQSREVRRAELRQRYFFECNCKKCLHDESAYQVFQDATIVHLEKQELFYHSKSLGQHAESRINTLRSLTQEYKALEPRIAKFYSLVETIKATATPSEYLDSLKDALSGLSMLKANQIFALAPYPMILDEIYLTYVDHNKLESALILLLFIFLNCDVYNWPQPNHPVRVTRLFTIVRLLRYVASLEASVVFQHVPFMPEEAFDKIDFVDAVQAMLILVNELAPVSHGKGSRFVRQVEEELREAEEVQRLRGGVGEKLKKWQSDSDAKSDGGKIASQIFEGLRTLAGYAFTVMEKQTL
ncbi:hypothetical protein G7Y89_g1188 [Cudoniella acicularis]|uniref:MYND-type zinc finger protein samB n=1 Tax=Cudoniella acicularis TaxID=354080 RepID=A0A8H4RVR3_9HELO|nr:hypothetical protein G7Y89_g1188 [Cudoniella acicularis]